MHILILSDAVDNQNAGVHFYTKKLIENLLRIDSRFPPCGGQGCGNDKERGNDRNRYSFIHCRENKFFQNTEHYIIPQKKGLGRESIRRLIKIPKLIKKLNPDIVLEPCHIGPFRLPKHIKRAVTIHDLTPVLFPNFHIKRSVIIHKLFLKKAIKNADLILANSINTKNDILKKYHPSASIEVIYLGIDKPNFNAPTPNINSPYILYLGTIEPRKNLPILIDAFIELKNQNTISHKLVLAGDIGWKSKEILKKAKHKDIIITGYLTENEKASWYSHADIFVYPSIYEGFGLPPLEAMSYGIPAICSTGGSLKEIFENHALLFEPKDKEKLKEHILALINNPLLKEKLASEGKKYASTFTWEETAKKTLAAFHDLLHHS